MQLHSPSRQTHGQFISRALPAAQQMGGADVALSSCTCEARSVRPGDVFVAIDVDGEGHDTAKQAVEQGAVAIVSDRYLPVFGVPQYVVEDSRVAYSELCHSLLDNPCRELNGIAIAGSHGKTSVAVLLESILLAAGKSVACQTNQYTRIDGRRSRLVLPTTAPGIAEFVDESLAAGCRHAVVELSEEAIRSQVASAAEFDVVCLTNLHGDQVAEDRSPVAIRQSIASAIKLMSPDGMAVFNADDQDSMRLLAEHEGPTCTFGLHHPADVAGSVVEQYVNEQTFFLSIGDDTAAVRTSIVGEAHIQNCLAAAAIARVYNVSLQDIALGIEQVTCIPGVMHRFDAGLGVSVFFDRGNTPIALGAVLSAARKVACGRVISVVNTPSPVTDALADHTISTCEFTKDAVVTEAVANVLAALDVTDGNTLRHIAEKLSGIAVAMLQAEEGDVVVASGLGSDLPQEHQSARSIKEPYLVQDLLNELAAKLPTKSAA
ncbi:MAG: Mur ligase family protein [Aeoliella sp.]